MGLRLQASFWIALSAGLCALVLQLFIEAPPVDFADSTHKTQLFSLLLLALISGFFAGWLLGPILGQPGAGGLLLGLIGAFLATILTGAVAGGVVGAVRVFLRDGFDPVGMFGEALAEGGMTSFVVTRLLIGSLPMLCLWFVLFLGVHLLMYRARRILVSQQEWKL
ncbi:hypothetical protein [Neomegalonema perideroedes]|uniref:hypothetical protein n=1 Tax=Neomegalonema perideroedes TaxID=217219 RepID=UPI000372C250|nr:hypothetical protein [Neomegalonema perideroedes]